MGDIAALGAIGSGGGLLYLTVPSVASQGVVVTWEARLGLYCTSLASQFCLLLHQKTLRSNFKSWWS